jgi:hypothetical protein
MWPAGRTLPALIYVVSQNTTFVVVILDGILKPENQVGVQWYCAFPVCSVFTVMYNTVQQVWPDFFSQGPNLKILFFGAGLII